MGCMLQASDLRWSHQMGGLWAVFGSFCQQGRLHLGPVVTHLHQFVQGGPICCSCQEAAVMPYCCNSGWKTPPLARWGNSVFELSSLSSRRLAQWSAMPLLWEVGLSPHPWSQLLFCTLHPLSKSSSPCPSPILWGLSRVPPHPPLSVVNYDSLFVLLSFVAVHLPRSCLGELHVALPCWFCRFTLAALKQISREK
jgi:hypothetical protein